MRIVMQEIRRWFGERFYHFPLQSDVKLHFLFYKFETFHNLKKTLQILFEFQSHFSMKQAPWNKQFRA